MYSPRFVVILHFLKIFASHVDSVSKFLQLNDFKPNPPWFLGSDNISDTHVLIGNSNQSLTAFCMHNWHNANRAFRLMLPDRGFFICLFYTDFIMFYQWRQWGKGQGAVPPRFPKWYIFLILLVLLIQCSICTGISSFSTMNWLQFKAWWYGIFGMTAQKIFFLRHTKFCPPPKKFVN